MHLFDDVRTSSTDITSYLWAWLDAQARGYGKNDRSAFTDDEWRLAIHKLSAKLYEDLSILDAKANGLISTNSISTAVISFVTFSVNSGNGIIRSGELFKIFCYVLLLIAIASLLLNISVIYVYWSTTTEISEQTDVDDRARSLIRVRNERTRRYRVAFILHAVVLSIVFFLIIILMFKSLAANV
jgi:hypothetical protein